MIQFRDITLADKPMIDAYMAESDFRSADYAFSTLFLWGHTFAPQIAEVEGRLLIKVFGGKATRYDVPVGKAPLKPALDALLQDARERGVRPCVRGITSEALPEIEALYGGAYDLFCSLQDFDYLYRADRLATVSGKKLHAKRSHIRRFEETYHWSFEPITTANFAECQAIVTQWYAKAAEKRELDCTDEAIAIQKMFSHYEELGMEGGLLRVEGAGVGFAVGTRLNSDTFVVRFEKADTEIPGVYMMLNREFSRQILAANPQIRYINREDDMGLDNLRKSKQSYDPECLVEKWTAVWRA